ncbi:hypothetical protein HRbin36_01835 [bacterium HR36]|nr:hypothetical protein HRbin36_01835 [bacterium HR36]
MPVEVLRRSDVVLVPAQQKAPPAPPVERRPLTLRVRTSANLLYLLLQAAKTSLSALNQASILIEVADPTGELAAIRDEVEKIFRDYGCSVVWKEGKGDDQ